MGPRTGLVWGADQWDEGSPSLVHSMVSESVENLSPRSETGVSM